MEQIVTISHEILNGTPVFQGTRVPIKAFFDYMKPGETVDEFLDDFPSVSKEQILDLYKLLEKLLFDQLKPQGVQIANPSR